jgi:hypothetical protein
MLLLRVALTFIRELHCAPDLLIPSLGALSSIHHRYAMLAAMCVF